ncbi:enoyl-CoA hydratase/isomerase family protein [Desulfuromonas carbonis]|uniref:enoyl-CoA hydratase/isomerase family protein n=1 Tax=Desulfuromonas sp. DDH964 TaxID=1823759 RepID=UPI00078E9A04|nr:enoyl-CoA hydratase/isomerase family protein [Desulfuromonas sp. DDH964]AMV70455.1 enoyl-CoA hydratase/isomerase [Desulfuromonas sp. DDH964]
MSNAALLSETDEYGRATITLNRPDLHNAFDDTLISSLTSELRRLDRDDNVRVVLLAARGKSFSSGADLNWMRRMADYSFEENLADAMDLAELMKTLANLAKPTIALVQGAAIGGGVGLVACCDIALATTEVTFCLSEVKLGLIPAVISPYVAAAIGPRATRRYFITAERFDAAEAHRLGLVHELVPPGELEARADSLSRLLLRNSPRAMASVKELVAEVSLSFLDDDLIADTAERIAEARASDEGREGLSAYLEKRPPNWIRG